MNYIDKVKEFHKLFDLPINDKHLYATSDDIELRLALIEEELDEFKEAIENRKNWMNGDQNNWHIEMLDALLDLQYVLSGAVLQLGFHKEFDKAFAEVHRSNMSKIFYCSDDNKMDKEARYLAKKYPDTEIEFDEIKPNTYLIRRLSDGKILKPSGYSPASLRRFFEIVNNS